MMNLSCHQILSTIRWKNFKNFLLALKISKQKKRETQFRKELYKNYYNAYKSDYDTDDELKEDKKKELDYKQFELEDKTNKESKLTELPIWLSSRNDFNEARKLINNIRADTNKIKSSSGNEKVFNDLNELINDMQNKKTTRKSAIKK